MAAKVQKLQKFACELSFSLPQEFEDDFEKLAKVRQAIRNALSHNNDLVVRLPRKKNEKPIVIKPRVGEVGVVYDV